MRFPTLAATTIACSACVGAAVAEPPPVFSRVSYDEAMAAAKQDGKMAIVDATADWCPPCKMMDQSTWVDDAVVAWIKEKAVAIQIDVDQEAQLARSLQIRAMPTVIIYKNGEEFDRAVGYKSAADLLAWLEGAQRGERAIDRLRREAGDRAGPDGKVNVQARLQMAQQLLQHNRLEEATDEFLWLWSHMVEHEPAMAGVRASFMASNMKELAERYAPARETFAKLRDEAEARLKGERKSWEDLSDWIDLNEIVGQEDKTLAWFDRIKEDPEAGPTLERFAYKLERLLQERDRWADVARLYRNPVAKVRRDHAVLQMSTRMAADDADAEQARMFRQWQTEHFRTSTAKLYAGLLAAWRDEDADKVAKEAMKLDDDPAMIVALIENALEAGQARPQHLDWARAAAEAGEATQGLTERIRQLLERQG